MDRKKIVNDDKFRNWLVSVRREIHRYPEIGYQEKKTADYVTNILKELKVQIQTGIAETGVVGLLGHPHDPCIGFRTELDALPLEESRTTHNKLYRSLREGFMHACGHDGHMAILLGVAKLLSENPNILQEKRLSVKLIFQPAEEGGAGARRMIEEKALESPRPQVLLAAHMYPELEVGNVGIYESQGYAYIDKFLAVLIGKGGHASRPHQCRDPVVAAAYFLTELQTVVSRSIDPLESAVVTVGRINGGTAANVIPEAIELEGTIRALSGATRDVLWRRIRTLAKGVATSFDLKCKLSFSEWYPPCVNDTKVARFMHGVCSNVLGEDKVEFLRPTMGAEDFAFYGSIVPIAMIRLGCTNKKKGICWDKRTSSLIGLHNSSFDIDEDVLPIGVSIFMEAIQSARTLPYIEQVVT